MKLCCTLEVTHLHALVSALIVAMSNVLFRQCNRANLGHNSSYCLTIDKQHLVFDNRCNSIGRRLLNRMHISLTIRQSTQIDNHTQPTNNRNYGSYRQSNCIVCVNFIVGMCSCHVQYELVSCLFYPNDYRSQLIIMTVSVDIVSHTCATSFPIGRADVASTTFPSRNRIRALGFDWCVDATSSLQIS